MNTKSLSKKSACFILAWTLLLTYNVFANPNLWDKTSREKVCEKIVEADVIDVKLVSDFGTSQQIFRATINVTGILHDERAKEDNEETNEVYFLRPKPGIAIRGGSHPQIAKGNSYILYLRRIAEIENLRSVLFVELMGDAQLKDAENKQNDAESGPGE